MHVVCLQIVDLHITRHHDTGKARACFVEFRSRDDMRRALELGQQSVPLGGRRVDIQPAEPKPAGRRGGGGARECEISFQ